MFRLDVTNAGAHARGRGFDVEADSARILAGGVSGTAISLDGDPPLVAKQALAQLAVEAPWTASPDRATTEARALRATHAITPEHVPKVFDLDAARHTLLLERAPADWVTWRDRLLAGPAAADIEVAARLGRILGAWHAATWGSADLRAEFADDEAFEDLRVAPFHREVVRRHPELEPVARPLIDQVSSVRECLVHGDFSPKNVLVGESGLWVIDHEVARYGLAVFDLAFMNAHLLLKAVHRPEAAGLLHEAARGFLDAYRVTASRAVDLLALGGQTAMLLLARVDGKSPAQYLGAPDQERLRRLAHEALVTGSPSIDRLWSAVDPRPSAKT